MHGEDAKTTPTSKPKVDTDVTTAVNVASSTAAALPPLPHDSLQLLLKAPRLPILPVTLPAAWQMNAENAARTTPGP